MRSWQSLEWKGWKMPIHLDRLDVLPELEEARAVLVVACNMCAGASLSEQEKRPFLQFFKSRLKSPPLEDYIQRLSSQLAARGIKARKFKAGIIQQFFLCLWTSRQRRKLREAAKECDAAVVLGCDSAVETVRRSVEGTGCRAVKGMEVAGVVNTKPKFRLPCDISFEDTRTVRLCDRHCTRGRPHRTQTREPADALTEGTGETSGPQDVPG
jgi:hypothetical protein